MHTIGRTANRADALFLSAAVAAMLAFAGCRADAEPTPAPAAAASQVTITTLDVRVTADVTEPELYQRYGRQIEMRLALVSPEILQPGQGMWVVPDDESPWLPGEPKPVRVGTITAVDPVTLPRGY